MFYNIKYQSIVFIYEVTIECLLKRLFLKTRSFLKHDLLYFSV
jgi:hypothetical protein